jgi:hypothetical protein
MERNKKVFFMLVTFIVQFTDSPYAMRGYRKAFMLH